MPDNTVKVTIQGEDQSGPAFKTAEASLAELGSLVAGLGGALGTGGLLAGLAAIEKSAAEAALQMDKLAQKVGASVPFLAEMSYAAKMVGVEQDSLASSLKFLDRAIAEATNGNQKYRDAFKGLGVAFADAHLQARPLQDVFMDLVRVFSQAADDPNKIAYQLRLLGRAGNELAPVFNLGVEGFKKFGDELMSLNGVPTAENIKQAHAMEEAWVRFGAALRGLENITMPSWIVHLAEMTNALAGVVHDITTGKILIDPEAMAQFELLKGPDAATMAEMKGYTLRAPGAGPEKKKLPNIPNTAADDAMARAQTHLAEVQAQRMVQLAQEEAKGQLAALNLLKDSGLITQKEYYAERIKIEIDSLNAEIDALAVMQAAAQAAVAKMSKGPDKIKAQADTEKIGGDLDKKLQERSAKIIEATLQEQEAERKLGYQVEAIEAEIRGAKNQTADVAIAAIHKEYDEKRRTLVAGGKDTSGLGAREDQAVAAAKAQVVGRQIEETFASLEERTQAVKTAEENYQVSTLTGEKQINEMRDQARAKVDGLVQSYRELAQASGDPKLIQNGDKYAKEIDKITVSVNVLRKDAMQEGQRDMEHFFNTILEGGKKGQNVFAALAMSIVQSLDRMLAKMLAVRAMGALIGLFGGGNTPVALPGAGGSDSLGPVEGPNLYASGGSMDAGQMGIVGDAGPELWVPDQAGTVLPNSQLGGSSHTVNYNIDARGASPGTAQEIRRALAMTEERAVQRSILQSREMSRRGA
jgi:hypothetical protein